MAEDAGGTSAPEKKRRRGILSRIWRSLLGGSSEDYEKRLQYLSKEEASVHARMKWRANTLRRIIRNLIVLFVMAEAVAVVYAIMTTRSLDLSWQMRTVRVLSMFILPPLSYVIYSTLMTFTRMFERKDQKTLERLRAERKAKIDELKERTNYYTTQQLIQKYDLDPVAKAAATAVLASKLGADSGLKVYVGDETSSNTTVVKSNDTQMGQSNGLRNRRQAHTISSSTVSTAVPQIANASSNESMGDGQEAAGPNHEGVEHYRGSVTNNGWIARVAALLVGEDPSQCYALICGACHMHNGLAKKEDFPYITYYCPHCHVLNTSKPSGERDSGVSSGKAIPLALVDENYPSDAVTENEVSSASVQELGQRDEKLDKPAS
ncbi:uncharacterized protein At2g24330-like [Typha angustifolia]|uniref:uncharacterized protein At2g24330-like n=1 Tax=Typha angustifolia TaxID=59011 RepID=UPI003C30D831